jgi:hypothetical protein
VIEVAGVTYLRMADAVDPSQLPLGMDAYAGYDNGRWPDYWAIAAAHPGAHLLEITATSPSAGQAGDFEAGDLTAAEAPEFVGTRLAAGIWRPACYGSIGNCLPDVVQALTSSGPPPTSFRLWSAHYGWAGQLPGFEPGQHICGPQTCGSPIQCDGTQWIDHGGWDESLLAADFFQGVQPVTNTLARPCVSIVMHPSGNGYWIIAQDGGIFAFGAAPALKPPAALQPGHLIQAAACTPTGNGLVLVGSDGGVFTVGDARFYGSVPKLGVSPSPQPLEA